MEFAWHKLFGLIYMSLACAYVLWRGERPERIAAAVYYGLALLSPLIHIVRPLDWARLDLPNLVLDTTVMILFLWIALTTRRDWTIWVAAFQLIGCSSHFGRAIDPSLGQWSYALLFFIPGYAIPLGIALGTRYEIDRPKRRGAA